ncbi:MAG TPA: divergent polysaccharide deacetylase family protein [Xanthobacteraceae bacterium]|nr:divergent polysaccharide deacetylase family protein [Xanthobacteraceae bacterium]
MTADDLTAPLRRRPKKRSKIKVPVAPLIAGALALFLAVFVLWAIVADDPFGGEPMAAVRADLHVTAKPQGMTPQPKAEPQSAPQKRDAAAQPGQASPPGTTTITIIDGKTGERHEVVVPGPASSAVPTEVPAVDPKFIEMTPRGPVPRIAADGTRPADAFARPVQPLPGKPGAPRIALIVSGLGVSANTTADAISKLPEAVTLSFVPYGSDVAALATRARSSGHEILLQVPMEPFNYPDNDPGPQTLLTTLTPQQNIDRLYTVMGKIQGYVGLTNAMGARFTASEDALSPVLREIAKRGLIYVDDGSSPRSAAGRIAGAGNLSFVRTDVVLDAVPTAKEIDHALDRLEMTAREHGFAVGMASALPVAIDRLAAWAKAAENRGLLLVPVSAIAARGKPI